MGNRNCESCGKPMLRNRYKQKWHTACRMELPGYMAGYDAGRRSILTPQGRARVPQDDPPVQPVKVRYRSLTKSQRQQIAREVLKEDKAELERELAEKKVRLEFLEREKALADCHARMLKAGFKLPEFRFHPDVETIHAEQQERV